MTRKIANWFHEREGELFSQDETPFDREELVQVIDDSVDPVQQISVDESRYYGIISYDEHDGWYEYTRWDDMAGEVSIGVCAKCIKDANSADKVARTLGDETDEAREKFEQHYAEDHAVDRDSVEVETGATLLSGTTINGNKAIHPGMDGAGSGVDADFVRGGEPTREAVARPTTTQSAGDVQSQFTTPSNNTRGVGVDNNDCLYLCSYGSGSIWNVNQSGTEQYKFAAPSNRVSGVGWDGNDLLISDTSLNADSIYKVSENNGFVYSQGSPVGRPEGIDGDIFGSIWVIDGDSDSTFKLDGYFNQQSSFKNPSNFSGLAVDDSNSIFLSANEGGVYEFDSSGTTISQFGTTYSGSPLGAGIDSNSKLWLADNTDDSIYKVRTSNIIQL